MNLSVIIPVHDERENLEPLYQDVIRILESMDVDFEIILVNDGIRDGSAEVLDTLARKDRRHERSRPES